MPAIRTERLFFEATYLLDQIGLVSGVTEDLKACFPDTYKQILPLAYYLVLEDQNPLFRFKKWASFGKYLLISTLPEGENRKNRQIQ